MPTNWYALLWSLWKPRGTPSEYPLVSGSWLNTWPMFESTKSNRTVMVISFLKLKLNYNSLTRSYIQAWNLLNTAQTSRDSLYILQILSRLCLKGPDSCELTARVSVLSRGNHLRILNLEYSWVTKGYERLEHRTSLLVTHEIMWARATLHLSGTVCYSGLSTCQDVCKPLAKLIFIIVRSYNHQNNNCFV